MRSKKGSEGGDMIILTVVFMVCILFGSIGLFAVRQVENQQEETQEEVVYSLLFEYQLQNYLLQPLDNPRITEFETLVSDIVDNNGRRQNDQIEQRKVVKLETFFNEFHSHYLPEKTCWELYVDGKKIAENTETCLLFRQIGIDEVIIPIESDIPNMEVIIR